MFELAIMILLGLWLADFGSGCVHWLVDTYCSPYWPIIGPGYVVFSHGHHHKPLELFEISIWHRHGYIVMFASIVAGVLYLLGWINPLTISALFFGAFANVIHGWSHHDAVRNGPVITAIHKTGLLQSPRHHVHHHSGTHTSHYCLLTDHVNPVLERASVFPRLEAMIRRVGLRPHWWREREISDLKKSSQLP